MYLFWRFERVIFAKKFDRKSKYREIWKSYEYMWYSIAFLIVQILQSSTEDIPGNLQDYLILGYIRFWMLPYYGKLHVLSVV